MHTVKLRILDPLIGREFPLPQHATQGSAGMDLRACIDAPMVLESGGLIPVRFVTAHDAVARTVDVDIPEGLLDL